MFVFFALLAAVLWMVVLVKWLVVFVVIVGVLALVKGFREVMLTSPPELAHCAPPPAPCIGNGRDLF